MSKNKVFRFAVGSANARRSTVWRVWAQDASVGKATASDVYIAPRNAAGWMKISLHQSGDWRWTVITGSRDTAADKSPPTSTRNDRHVVRWQRPAEFTDRVTIAFRVFIPESELRRMPDPRLKPEDVRWLDPPKSGCAIEIAAIVIRADDVDGWPGKNKMGTQLLGIVPLLARQHLFVVYYECRVTDEFRQQIEDGKRAALATAPRDRAFGPSDSRLHLFGWRDEDGSRFFIDAAPDFARA